jgi:F0F1-type ATP synthase membrane subunit c/vacuolar-type H+-ATPase subunit K
MNINLLLLAVGHMIGLGAIGSCIGQAIQVNLNS